MKAVQIKAPHEMGVVQTAQPQRIGKEDVCIRLSHVGFCGSDLNTYLGRNPMVKLPVIPGHEVGAVIESVGSDVPDMLKPGMSVTVNPYTNCDKCAACRNGRVNACAHNETLGVQRNGVMCERAVLPWQKIIPAPGIPPRDCALIEPMSVGFHAVDRAGVTDIDIVLVIGCGMIGIGAIVRAALRGATVIAVDLDDEKLALARRIGARYTLNSQTDAVHERLQKITGGFGADVVIEAVGSTPTYRMAIEEVGFTGRVVCIGYAPSDVPLTTKLFVQKELNIYGSRNALPTDFRAVIRYMQTGNCPVDAFISAVVAPEEAAQAVQKWAEHPGKVFRILVSFTE
ncbi:MAG: zinc-binding alcohol dehydrogenase family protein [Prevotellaceae bacterium]|jgi:threonine dehydrogenase-like Zn-dependent dehydrogenase|nr:zinc-binding alcohol dehydrogenase family protein [Prevotellaceae bacterium]